MGRNHRTIFLIMAKIIDETNNIYEFLKVVSFAGMNSRGRAMWNCECNCGHKNCLKTTVVRGYSLRSGNTRSCGALRKLTKDVVLKALALANMKPNDDDFVYSDTHTLIKLVCLMCDGVFKKTLNNITHDEGKCPFCST